MTAPFNEPDLRLPPAELVKAIRKSLDDAEKAGPNEPAFTGFLSRSGGYVWFLLQQYDIQRLEIEVLKQACRAASSLLPTDSRDRQYIVRDFLEAALKEVEPLPHEPKGH